MVLPLVGEYVAAFFETLQVLLGGSFFLENINMSSPLALVERLNLFPFLSTCTLFKFSNNHY